MKIIVQIYSRSYDKISQIHYFDEKLVAVYHNKYISGQFHNSIIYLIDHLKITLPYITRKILF